MLVRGLDPQQHKNWSTSCFSREIVRSITLKLNKIKRHFFAFTCFKVQVNNMRFRFTFFSQGVVDINSTLFIR